MTSNIDPTKPTAGVAYTADVRSNFATAKAEITELQARTAALVEGGHEAWTPLGYAQATCNFATALPSIPPDAVRAVVLAENDNLRFRDDGTDPTPTTGMMVFNGQTYTVNGSAGISAIKFIGVSGAGAKLNVSYYK